jgi:hypothetical protein
VNAHGFQTPFRLQAMHGVKTKAPEMALAEQATPGKQKGRTTFFPFFFSIFIFIFIFFWGGVVGMNN